MGAIGAAGGVGGGLGSVGGSAGSGWYDASSVMETGGEVDGNVVSLDDADVSSQYVLGENRPQQPEQHPLPPAGTASPEVQSGVGDSPSADVVSQIAAVYAASSSGDASASW